MTARDAKALGLRRPGGVIVSAVERDAPAQRAGLKAGDVIAAIDNATLVTAEEVVRRVLFGAVVYGVTPDTDADRAGLKRGDVVQQVNRQVLRNAADVTRALDAVGQSSYVFLLVWRAGDHVLLQMRD